MMNREVIRIFSKRIRSILEKGAADSFSAYRGNPDNDSRLWDGVEEIRLRTGQPLVLCIRGEKLFLDAEGKRTDCLREAFRVRQEDIRETLEYISHYSLYAFEEEVRQGFITIPGGHRIGLAGKAVVHEGKIQSLKYISFLNVRLAHQVPGCADPFLPYIRKGDRVGHTLIISPPRMGKTTLLRDLIRQISDGSEKYPAQNVAVADERSELGACSCGIPQNDLGRNTDVMDGCPKASGIRMLIRTMAPQVIAMDEAGSAEDMEALVYGMNCGCSVIAAIHGESLEDIRRKPVIGEVLKQQLFDTYILLNPDGSRSVRWRVLNREGRVIAEGKR